MNQESLSEIEEEMNPNINNGMQAAQEFQRLKDSLEINQTYFLVLQIKTSKVKEKDPES